MKYLTYIILMIFSFIIQTTFIQHIAIGGVMPNLMLLIVICVAFMQGERMPYVKCFKRDLAGKKSIFWIALRPELEGIGKDFKKN